MIRGERGMLEHFADWHRDAGIEPNAETSQTPKAIEEYSPGASEIISLARLFYGFITQEDASLAKFTAALATADPTLSTRDTNQLMTVFAGAELIAVLSRNDDSQLSDLSALCVVSGAAQPYARVFRFLRCRRSPRVTSSAVRPPE